MDTCNYRYMLKLQFRGVDGTFDAMAFDDVGQDLFKINCNDFVNLSETAQSQIISRLEYREWMLRVSA